MKFLPKRLSKAFILLGLGCLLMSCGSGSSSTDLLLLPVGPTDVALGQTLQFTPTEGGVIYVVIGGDANGTITPLGLYTAPTEMPTSPDVTIMGELDKEQTFSFIHLSPN